MLRTTEPPRRSRLMKWCFIYPLTLSSRDAEPGTSCTWGVGSLPLMTVAAEVSGRGSVKVTQMTFELETACESKLALEHGRNISICSCHSFSFPFHPVHILWIKKRENTSALTAGVPGPPVGKGGEGLEQSQQGMGLKPGPGHAKPLVKLSWRHMATQQPRSLWAPRDLYHTGHEGWSWATRHRGVQAKPPFHAPTHATGALTGLRACGFCFGFKEGEQMPKKQC